MPEFSKQNIEIIPAIDLRGGNCVRLHQGCFEAETLFDKNPVQAARRISNGARMLHVVDLDGARAGRSENLEVIESLLSALQIPIQFGGGVRTQHDIRMLLDIGVHRVVLGSLAVEQPQAIVEWMRHFGAERVVIALDARADENGVYYVATRGWQKASNTRLIDALEYYSTRGVKYVLCTDIECDGAMRGPSIDLYAELAAAFPQVSLQASGGVRHGEDLAALAAAGVRHVIVGRALLEGGLVVETDRCQRSA